MRVAHHPDVSVMLAYHYFALRAANEIEPFRYRLRDGKVIIHDVIHGGTTVLLPVRRITFGGRYTLLLGRRNNTTVPSSRSVLIIN